MLSLSNNLVRWYRLLAAATDPKAFITAACTPRLAELRVGHSHFRAPLEVQGDKRLLCGLTRKAQ